MTSSVSICSNALLTLGDTPINDFNENNDRARLCANLYPSVRDSLLRRHPWNCAVKRVILSPVSDKPAYGYGYQFNLPADYLRILSVEPDDYRLEGRRILTNSNVVYLGYVFKNEDESTYDPGLVSLLEMAMAARMAYAITKSASLRDALAQEFEFAVRQAKAIDGQEEPAQELGGYPLLEARNG